MTLWEGMPHDDALCLHALHDADGGAVCPVCGAKTENAQRIRDALPPQTILHGQYLLGAALGGGGFGTTYRALKLESVDPGARRNGGGEGVLSAQHCRPKR